MKEVVEENTDTDKMGKYRKILIDKFPRNFRYDSGLEIRKFKLFNLPCAFTRNSINIAF